MSMKAINEIRSQIRQLNSKLVDAKVRLKEECMAHHAISIGDRITVHSTRGDYIVEVTGWRATSYNAGHPVGRRVKKNGETGYMSAGHISEWTKLI